MAKSGGSSGPARVGVVTVSYGSEPVLSAFLASVARASSEAAPIVVADNLPDEGDVRSLAESARAEYLPMPSNLGYGSAVNAAISSLPRDIEWVLVSNPVVVLEPGVLDRLREAGDEDPTIASIGPAVYNADGTLYPSARAV